MDIVLMTREYPPEVYGGAGVHVDYLSRELARLARVRVRCFGSPRPRAALGSPGGPFVEAFRSWPDLAGSDRYASALQTLSVELAMAAGLGEADVVHSHTWYANTGGH